MVYTGRIVMGIGIREARNNLPSLIKRAAEEDEEIRVGARGADEVTLVASRKYDRMRQELNRLRSEIARLTERLDTLSDKTDRLAGEGQPFAGLQRALENGSLSVGHASALRVRRYIPDYVETSSASREARVRFGQDTAEPQYRRLGPRA